LNKEIIIDLLSKIKERLLIKEIIGPYITHPDGDKLIKIAEEESEKEQDSPLVRKKELVEQNT